MTEDHIIKIALDDIESADLRDPLALYKSVSRRKWYSYNGINGFSHGRHKIFKHLRLAYTYQSHFHSHQIYIHFEAAGFRSRPVALF